MPPPGDRQRCGPPFAESRVITGSNVCRAVESVSIQWMMACPLYSEERYPRCRAVAEEVTPTVYERERFCRADEFETYDHRNKIAISATTPNAIFEK